jgi:uncharacterized protein YecE (DUF72 family)
MPELRIGTSGWKYPNWRGDFYPAGLRHADELRFLARYLNSAEINGSFYSLQTPGNYAAWREATPPDFRFAVKGGRFITHLKKLLEPRPGLANFFGSGPLALGDKLGPFLWQLPEALPFDASRIADFLSALPTTRAQAAELATECDRRIVPEPFTRVAHDRPLRHALEVRHESYRDDGFLDLLHANGVALVQADTAGRFPYFQELTAGFVYARLHGPHTLYSGSYSPDLIGQWAHRVGGWLAGGHDVYVYFDNDAEGAAPHDALALAQAVAHC